MKNHRLVFLLLFILEKKNLEKNNENISKSKFFLIFTLLVQLLSQSALCIIFKFVEVCPSLLSDFILIPYVLDKIA